MENKNKILAFLILLMIIFTMAQLLGSVSAANGKVIDKGIAPYKDYKDIKLNWNTKIYENNKLKVYKSFSKNNSVYKIKKTTFKRINKSNLKVSIIEMNNGNIIKTNKYVKIKKFRSLKSYYSKIYQPKILKNIVKSKSFDSGQGYLSNRAHGRINWNARIYYNGKILIKEDIGGINSYTMKTIIERYSKGKLKITNYIYDEVYDNEKNKFIKQTIKNITHVKSKLSPKNYYLKVYKPKMIKYLSDHEFGCIEMIYISPKMLMYEEIGYGDLNNFSGRIQYSIHNFYDGKVVISRNYTDNSFLNSTTTIQQFNETVLKILVAYVTGNNSDLYYVNYSSDPYTYFLNIYKPEMLTLIKGNVTIIKNSIYPIIKTTNDYS